nr:Hsp20/alpha crystallin family protein [Nitrosopumilaceae archaeon]NIU86702.1 Hsp20 family protein [Nitrosopumilaceae archaeon]NIV65399.1 Hsp20 family protein [Nitrosopumilaceae archaeon]NIX60899.1 Hsp20 family protein [Nitrosopumilaceae archaeon]
LTVSAEKQTSEDSENKYIIRRFSKRSFNKKYDLDGIWDTNSVEADFSDGVLTLSFTKKEEEQTTVKRVEI